MKKLIATLMVCLVLASTFCGLAIAKYSVTPSGSALNGDEIYWLTYMREDEKLARDVYIYPNGQWDLLIFQNIAESEQKHMDSIKTLLDKYGLSDPAAGKGISVFANPDLQILYNELIESGSVSKYAALKVGEFIEYTDIADLNEGIATTAHREIKNVYSNLLQGSLNHLAAFQANLAKY